MALAWKFNGGIRLNFDGIIVAVTKDVAKAMLADEFSWDKDYWLEDGVLHSGSHMYEITEAHKADLWSILHGK
jgi:hypothetical protein